MKTRFFSGLLLAIVVLGIWAVGGIALEILIYVAIAVSVFEVYHALNHAGIRVPYTVGLFFVAMLPIAIHTFRIKGILALFMLTGMLILAFQVFKADLTIQHTAYTFFTLFYPCMMLSMLPMTLTFPGEGGRMALIMTIACACVTDIFAYFSGMLCGRHKLCPTISPQKTVEGALGGVLGGMLAGIIVGLCIQPFFTYQIALWHLVLLGLLCSIAGQVGDLAASIIKRSTGIKDFGKIFPGHGGVMDRMDSILFVAPIVYCYFSLVIFSV